MNQPSITTAMLFAAGFGKRMQPLTHTTPKPLLNVGGFSMLDRALEHLNNAGVTRTIVNTHYLADKITQHLAHRHDEMPNIILSHEEPQILETAGGIIQALPHLGIKPFFSINGDIVWLDGTENTLTRLASMWNPDQMDMLLLLHPTQDAIGYDGEGDFSIADNGKLSRTLPKDYVFTGIQIIHPRIFNNMPPTPLSLSHFYHKAQQADGTLNRIYGLVHEGTWLHIGTPEGLEEANQFLANPNFA